MIRISVWHRDLSESYLKQVTQLGADCIDFGQDTALPGVKEQGYPDLEGVLKIKKQVESGYLAQSRKGAEFFDFLSVSASLREKFRMEK
jgi:hypothetical protein